MLSRGRRLRPAESLRLQGIRMEDWAFDMTRPQIFGAAGNTMSVNVLQRILERVLVSIGFSVVASAVAAVPTRTVSVGVSEGHASQRSFLWRSCLLSIARFLSAFSCRSCLSWVPRGLSISKREQAYNTRHGEGSTSHRQERSRA